jgi:hypothetical protein
MNCDADRERPSRAGSETMRLFEYLVRWKLLSWAVLIGLYALSLRYFTVAGEAPSPSRIAAQPTPIVADAIRR